MTELISFEDLVKDKFFQIPDYQRGYAWEKKHIEDLIEDIEHLLVNDGGHKHYTGTIVITNAYRNIYEVVDGQQRLTTLIILMQQIHRMGGQQNDLEELFIRRNDQYVLETNKETNEFFKQVIFRDRKELADINSKAKIEQAKKTLSEWLEKKRIEGLVEEVYDTVRERLGFLCFCPENTNEIGIMFEVINNRGKGLSELEKIKNYFIYYSTIKDNPELLEKVNDRWGYILKHLNSAYVQNIEEENSFLRNCYLVFYSTNKAKSWHVYEQLKEQYEPQSEDRVNDKLGEISNFLDFLEEAAQHYAWFNNPSDNPDRLRKVLNRLRCHPVNASILPMYISVMSFWADDKNRENICDVLDFIEKLNFRVYVLPNAEVSRNDTHQGILFSWANEAFKYAKEPEQAHKGNWEDVYGSSSKGDVFEILKTKSRDFTLRNCSEKVFVDSLTVDSDEGIDYYKWQGLKFFLASYEEFLKEGKREFWNIAKILKTVGDTRKTGHHNDYLSSEHIWAKENRSEVFPCDYRDKRRLGNFVLLGLSYNQSLNKADIRDKINWLNKKNSGSLCQINELIDLCQKAEKFADDKYKRKRKNYYKDLARHLIDQRENKLIKFALERWRINGESFEKFEKVDSFKAETDNENAYSFFKK